MCAGGRDEQQRSGLSASGRQLQLLWQVGGLAALLYVGSPQSKENSDRMEAKLDAILRSLDPEKGEQLIKELDDRHSRDPEERREGRTAARHPARA